jgi:hypothetical protein
MVNSLMQKEAVRLKVDFWNRHFGEIEKEALGSSPSWPAESFQRNFMSLNTAGIGFAVHQVLEDCFQELDQTLEMSDEIELDDLDFARHLPEVILHSDAAAVFRFLVFFVKEARLKEIDLPESAETRLRDLKPKVIEHQNHFEVALIQKINLALDSARGRAEKSLNQLEI